jgi:hypothetical protein
MTPRHARWAAAAASLLLQVWFVGIWWWVTAGCFCSVGDGRPVPDAAVALFKIVTYPVEHLLPRSFTGSHPVTLGAASFWVWFAVILAVLRMGMIVARALP